GLGQRHRQRLGAIEGLGVALVGEQVIAGGQQALGRQDAPELVQQSRPIALDGRHRGGRHLGQVRGRQGGQGRALLHGSVNRLSGRGRKGNRLYSAAA